MNSSTNAPDLNEESVLANCDGQRVVIEYKNWKGKISTRSVEPVAIWFGSTEWHPEKQYFMRALDTDKGELRDFALKDIVTGDSDA